jgi:putative peptide zinc metalloprotease protein
VKGRGGEEPLELVLRDGTRVPIAETVTIGRAPDNTIRLDDPSVSRHHATVVVNGGSPPQIVDAGSRAGTILNGRKLSMSTALADGTTIQLGNSVLRVERRRDESEAGRTVVVRAGSTVLVPVAGKAQVENATAFGFKPKLRSGWALKRLAASEGEKRFVLHDLRGGGFARMGADEAAIIELLDGRHSLVELITEAERRIGAPGAGVVASLLADLGEKGYLAGVEGSGAGSTASHGRLGRLLEPRNFTVSWLGPLFERLYRRGGFVFFTRPAVALLTAIAVGGAAVWIYLVASRYGTPFVVAKKVGLGGVVFLLGRFVVVAVHEIAHGLTVSSFGRRVPRAGLKLILVFPYAFVDTSEAWFEPRRRRLAISGAGPISDFVVGGLFSLAALPSGDGTLRDIFFNLAFAAYVGAFFNLNPFLERDGYHMLVDLMREPGLRRRSRQWLVAILAGRGRATRSERHSRLFEIYGVTSVLWLFSGLLFALVGTKRLYPRLVDLAPREVVWVGLAAVYLLALLPIAIVIGRPLLQRWRETPEVEHAEA